MQREKGKIMDEIEIEYPTKEEIEQSVKKCIQHYRKVLENLSKK